jgi:hypothetical protein
VYQISVTLNIWSGPGLWPWQKFTGVQNQPEIGMILLCGWKPISPEWARWVLIMHEAHFTIKLSTEIKGLDIYYTFDCTNPDSFYPKYSGEPIKFPLGATQLNVITYRDGKPIGKQVNIKKEELANRINERRHEY